MARECSPTTIPQALGAVGFMRHDYVNFGFDEADVIVTVGYELQEFDPVRINPRGDKEIIHIHRFPAEVDVHYNVAVGLQADIGRSLDALAAALDCHFENQTAKLGIRVLLARELARGKTDDRFPAGPGSHRGRHSRRNGSRGHRARRHRRTQDVDGPAVPDLLAEHLPDLKRLVDDGVDGCPAPSAPRSPDRTPGCSSPPAMAAS